MASSVDADYFAIERGLGSVLPVIRDGSVIGLATTVAEAEALLSGAVERGRALLSNPTCRGRWAAAYDTDAFYPAGAVIAPPGISLALRPEDVGIDSARVVPGSVFIAGLRAGRGHGDA